MASLKGISCTDCGFKHPAGVACCPDCGSANIAEFVSSGKGSIYTFTISTFVPAGRHKSRAPYVVAVIETEEGMRLASIVEGVPEPAKVKIGDPVLFAGYEERTGPLFRPV